MSYYNLSKFETKRRRAESIGQVSVWLMPLLQSLQSIKKFIPWRVRSCMINKTNSVLKLNFEILLCFHSSFNLLGSWVLCLISNSNIQVSGTTLSMQPRSVIFQVPISFFQKLLEMSFRIFYIFVIIVSILWHLKNSHSWMFWND